MSNKRSFGSDHLKFLLAGIAFVIFLDWSLPESRPVTVAEKQAQAAIPPDIVKFAPEISIPKQDKHYGPEALPQWRRNAAAAHFEPGQPKVIIVIDDLGVSRGYTKETLELPGPLTLAFLPYAERLEPLIAQGRSNGHEIMVHMPMEPMDGAQDMGGIFLDMEQTPEEFAAMLTQGLDAFGGYAGINNHMGSRLTQDRARMRVVMAELKERGLLFLDSRTIGSSVAAETAASFGVPYAVRDVFLDHDESLEAVKEALAQTERRALAHGQAIAIGHPKRNTIDALKEWLPTLEEKGIALVPVSAVVITTTPSGVSSARYGPPAPPRQ